jgi:D-psicose/D-tagatose/L-ribulose 3-epimerase
VRICFYLLVVGGHITDEHLPLLERLKGLGYDGVEVPVFDGPVSHYEGLGRRLKELGLGSTIVTIVGEDTSPISPERQIRSNALDRLRWSIDCAAALGADVMAGPYHSPLGVFTGHGPTEDELERLVEVMQQAADHAEPAGVTLAIEALNRFECYALNTMEQCAALKRRVDRPAFSFQFDTFHANIEEQDPVEAYRRHARDIAHIHISENDRGIPGRGHVPFADHFRAFREAGYDGWLTVEAFGRALPSLAAATRIWRDLFPDVDTLLTESIATIRRHWEDAAPPPRPAMAKAGKPGATAKRPVPLRTPRATRGRRP